MRVDCLVENIESHISLLGKILPTHTQIPIFSNILIEATSHGLYLSATDLEMGIKIKIPAKIEEEGVTTVPGKQFIETILNLPKDKIHFYTEKDTFFIESGNNTLAFQTIPATEFPHLFDKKGEKIAMFKKEDFKNIFSKLLFAVSSDESRPVITGVLLSQKNNETIFVATDGYRLSVKTIKKSIFNKIGAKFILSARLIHEVFALKNENEEIEMFVFEEGNQIFFENSAIQLMGRLIGGEFPPYEAVIPTSFKTRLIMDREELLRAVKLSSVFSRESAYIVKFKVANGALHLFSKASGVGEGEMKVDVEQKGDDNEIAFNTQFLLDLLKNLEDESITMELNSGLESALFRSLEDDSFIHIIMPVRVQEEQR